MIITNMLRELREPFLDDLSYVSFTSSKLIIDDTLIDDEETIIEGSQQLLQQIKQKDQNATVKYKGSVSFQFKNGDETKEEIFEYIDVQEVHLKYSSWIDSFKVLIEYPAKETNAKLLYNSKQLNLTDKFNAIIHLNNRLLFGSNISMPLKMSNRKIIQCYILVQLKEELPTTKELSSLLINELNKARNILEQQPTIINELSNQSGINIEDIKDIVNARKRLFVDIKDAYNGKCSQKKFILERHKDYEYYSWLKQKYLKLADNASDNLKLSIQRHIDFIETHFFKHCQTIWHVYVRFTIKKRMGPNTYIGAMLFLEENKKIVDCAEEELLMDA